MNIRNEISLLIEVFSNTKFRTLKKTDLYKELSVNGIALLVTLIVGLSVHGVLSNFIREKNNTDRIKEKINYTKLREKIGILRKLERKEKDERVALDKEEISFVENTITNVIVFVLGLFVFTYTEAFIERYLDVRAKRTYV